MWRISPLSDLRWMLGNLPIWNGEMMRSFILVFHSDICAYDRREIFLKLSLLLLLLSHFSRVWLCATLWTAAHQAPPSLGFSRHEHWSGLPFPSPMHESEKRKWSLSVVSDSSRPHELQPTRLLRPWDSPGKIAGVGCHCLLQCMKVKRESEVSQSCLTLHDPLDCSLPGSSIHGSFQARVLEGVASALKVLDGAAKTQCSQK